LEDRGSLLVLYDGVCGLCDRLVAMVLRKDRHDRFRFAPLQSALAAEILKRHGLEQSQSDTVYLVQDYGAAGERLLQKSDAFVAVLQGLGGFWVTEAAIFKLAPRFLRDRLYEAVARNRYRVFGRYEACIVPHPRYRDKFLA
jgi:predicted DCC family thiol-disulfide oxidoreductase YuxK